MSEIWKWRFYYLFFTIESENDKKRRDAVAEVYIDSNDRPIFEKIRNPSISILSEGNFLPLLLDVVSSGRIASCTFSCGMQIRHLLNRRQQQTHPLKKSGM